MKLNEHTAKEELMKHCADSGLLWNDGNWLWLLPQIRSAGLTHEQTIALGKAHIALVSHLFNPKAYSWRGRLTVVGHFLFNFKRK